MSQERRTSLITGASGFLGRAVFKHFKDAGWNVIGTGLTRANPPEIVKIELNDGNAVRELLEDVRPQVIIHCAANRSPDKCDADPAGARSINVDASRTLAAAAAAHNALLVYISTEYVFPGTPGEAPYEADAPAAPVNIYGQTKLDGEKAVLAIEDGNAVVLRLPLLYGAAESPAESGVNVLTYAVLKARDKNASEIDIDDWQKRYPTNTADVARVCVDIARKYTDASRPCEALPEILQFSSDFQVTRYQMCRILAGIMGSKTEKLKPKKEEAHSDMTATKRPFDTHMSNKVLMELGISTECIDFEAWWREELKDFSL